MSEPAPGARVYVVDDDVEVCDSVSYLLGTIGVEPTALHSADAFLEIYQGDHPACVVLDIRMPRLSGMQLQVMIAPRYPHLQIIFVSAHGDIRMSVQGIQRGAFDFLEKPYDPQTLIDAVQAAREKAEREFAAWAVTESLQAKVDALTPREREVLILVVEGTPSQNIARRLRMSVKTVDVHRARIKAKTNAESINTLVRDILRSGLEMEPPSPARRPPVRV